MTFDLHSTRATNASGSVTMQASSHLMDDFVYATDLGDETDIVTVQQADGSYSLLYIGRNDNLMSLRQDSQSDTGWTEEDLKNDFAPQQVVGAVTASGTFVAFATGPNVAEPDIYMSSRQGDGTWAAWSPIAVGDAVPPSMMVTNLEAFSIDGTVELFVILGPSPGEQGQSSVWRIDWQTSVPTWHYIADTDQSILSPCTIAGFGPSILYANSAANPAVTDLFVVPSPFTAAPSLLAGGVSFTDLAVGAQADQSSAVFIADNGYLSGTPQIQYLNGGIQGAAFERIGETEGPNPIIVSALAVGSAGARPTCLFILDAAGILHIIESAGGGQWEPPVDLALRLTNILSATGPDGDAELIGIVPAKGLLRMWRNPAEPGTTGGWNQEPIQYMALNQTITPQSTYATTVTFYGADGAPLASQTVNLRSTEIVSANIAGEVRVLGPNRPLACETDANGRIRITTPTQSLEVTQLSASVPGIMQAEEDFSVTPNSGIQNRLKKFTTEDVHCLSPGTPKSDAEAIANAVVQSLENIQPGLIPLVRARSHARADLKTPFAERISPGKAFRFTVANGRATYQELTAAEVEVAMAEFGGRPTFAPDGFFDFFEDIVDAVGNAFEDAVDAVYHYVVEPVIDGVRIGIRLVIEGAEWVWKGVIRAVEDAFRFVESVFSAVLIFFEKLYKFLAWLLSDARKEIWATKQQFEKIFNQGMTSLAGYAGQGASVSATFFLGVEQTISSAFDQILKDLGSENANQAINAPAGSGITGTLLEIIQDASAVSDWLFDKISVPLVGTVGVDVRLAPSIALNAENLIAQIGSTFVQQIVNVITAFLNNLQALANNTANLGNALLATILKDAKAVIMAILAMLDSLTQSFLQFFSQNLPAINSGMFNAPLNNFVMQALYDLINPGSSETLTVLGLGSLLAAFVTTTLYRLIFDAAPFPIGDSTSEISAVQPADVFLILSGILQASLWLFIDASVDIKRTGDAPVWFVLSMLTLIPMLIQLLAWPGGPGAVPSFGNDRDKSKWSAYFVGFAASGWTALWSALYALGRVKTGPRGTLPGSLGLCVGGAASFGMNCWMVHESDKNAWTIVTAIAGPLSPMAKPVKFLLPPVESQATLAIVDFISDVGAGVSKFCRIILPPEITIGDHHART